MKNNLWGDVTGIRPVKIARTMLNSGKSEEEFIDKFKNELKVSDEKTQLTLNIAIKEINILKNFDKNDICLYIGVPFCKTRCLYCSFVTNSAAKNNKYMRHFVRNLKTEIEYTAGLLKKTDFNIVGLYFGGGTPTTLSSADLEDVINKCYESFDLSNLVEFTVEAGRPDTIDAGKLNTLKKCGVTRISINPQTMNDNILKVIGRAHSVQDIYDSFKLARECGFDNINMDLIAGLPTETFEEFKKSVDLVTKLSPECITIHTMSIKRGSVLHEKLGDYALTDENTVFDMVEYSINKLNECGFYPYYLYRQKHMVGNFENIGYAKEGKECLYNIMIMEETNSIVSMGCGGVTKIVNLPNDRIERVFNVKEAKDYTERIEEMIHRKDIILDWLNL